MKAMFKKKYGVPRMSKSAVGTVKKKKNIYRGEINMLEEKIKQALTSFPARCIVKGSWQSRMKQLRKT